MWTVTANKESVDEMRKRGTNPETELPRITAFLNQRLATVLDQDISNCEVVESAELYLALNNPRDRKEGAVLGLADRKLSFLLVIDGDNKVTLTEPHYAGPSEHPDDDSHRD